MALRDGDVHVWVGELDKTVSELYRFIHPLSSDERMRAERFHFEKDRNRFIVRHGILRMILGHYLDLDANRLRFHHGENGKPVLNETPGIVDIKFNLSHSNGVALFAFARHSDIGVDIEYIRDISEMDLLAERYFSITENDVFRSIPKNQRKEAFFKCWTCKEAFVKALGDGLSWSLGKFDVSMVPGESGKLLRIKDDSKEASQWFIQTFNPTPDYVGSIAVRSRIPKIRCWKWKIF